MGKITSIILALLGVVLFIYGNNMATEVAIAEGKVSEVSTGERRPTLGPVRRNVRAQSAENKQTMVSNLKQTIAATETNANWLRGIGALLFIVGAGGFVFCCKKRA